MRLRRHVTLVTLTTLFASLAAACGGADNEEGGGSGGGGQLGSVSAGSGSGDGDVLERVGEIRRQLDAVEGLVRRRDPLRES